MTVISESKKSRNQTSGVLADHDESIDSNSNDIVDNNDASHVTNDLENIDQTLIDNDDHFPTETMRRFIEMVNKPRWVVPVLPKDDLEKMILLTIKYAYKKRDEETEQFKDIYKLGFLVSFEKIFTDEAVLGWKIDILDSIYRNSVMMMKLCSMKIMSDNEYILEVLSIVFNPDVKYHQCCTNNFSPPNITRVNLLEDLIKINKYNGENIENEISTDQEEDGELPQVTDYKYAFTNDNRRNKIIYVDLINLFGFFNGFRNMRDRFEQFQSLDLPDLSSNLTIVLSLLRPLALSIDFLTINTIREYIVPITDKTVQLILNLDKDIIKQEAIKEGKSDKFSNIIQHLEIILKKIKDDHDYLNKLSLFRLNIILKILQHASFNGRMNALNELNKLIKSMYTSMYQPTADERLIHIINWIKDNEVLSIALKENLHQPQYVEKVEKLIRFMIKENGLTNDDLDRLWDSQIGKHDAIVTNIHDLLAKLAYDFNPAQLHHLFDCFQKSWSKASKKQRERLIDLIRRLAEEDKEGRMAKTALNLLWDLATQDDSPLDILESALRAHAKILDFSCIQDRDCHRNEWLINLIKYLSDHNSQKNAVSTLRQIKEIIKLFQQPVFNAGKCVDRRMIIRQLDKDQEILNLVTNNLVDYVENFRLNQSEYDVNENNPTYLDDKFPHDVHIDERLDILKFLLSDGSLTLNSKLLTKIWDSLVVSSDSNNSHTGADRDQCFKWLVNLMENSWSIIDDDVLEGFFQNQFLKLDPKLLTLNGISLFEHLFKTINLKKGFIDGRDSDNYVINQMDLIGLDYLWRCAMFCSDDDVFNKIINMLKVITTNLGFNLIPKRKSINEEFIQHCTLILSSAFDTAKCLLSKCQQVSTVEDNFQENYYEVSFEMEDSINKLINIIQILCEFVRECDNRFVQDRSIQTLSRMSYGHRRVLAILSNSCISRNNSVHHTDIEVHSNELIINLRTIIEAKLKDVSKDDYYLEISKGNETILEEKDNFKTIEQMDIINGTVLHTRWIPKFTNKLNCNKLDISDEHDPEKYEENLPGVMISKNKNYMELIVNIGDLSLIINNEKLRWSIQHLLNLLPPDQHLLDQIMSMRNTDNNTQLREILHLKTPMQIIYAVNVLYCLLLPCNNMKAAKESILLLKHLLLSNGLEVLLEIINFDQKQFMFVFVPKSCETSSIRLIGLIRLLKIIYILLTIFGGVTCYKDSTILKFKKLHDILKKECSRYIIPYEVITEKLEEIMKDEELVLPVSTKCLPRRKDVDSLIKLSWCCAIGNKLEYMSNDIKKFHEKCMINSITERSRSVASFRPDPSISNINKFNSTSQDIHCSVTSNNGLWRNENDVYDLANQPTFCAVECLTLVLACSNDTNILDLIKEKYTKEFIIVLLLYTRSGNIRRKAAEELRLILRFSDNSKAIEHVIQMLFTKLHNVSENPIQYGDVFNLVVKLLNDTHKLGSQLSNTEALFKCQLDRLLEMKCLGDNTSNQGRQTQEVLLIGRLRIIKELLRFFTPQAKANQNKAYDLINTLLNTFFFPSSKRYSDINIYQQEQQRDFQSSYMENNREFPSWATAQLMNPICNTVESQKAAFDLLKALVAGSLANMEVLCEKLTTLFYNDHRCMHNEWDYKPSFVSRSATGFVGLKNAGATCYMNSILQQLFMIDPIRGALLGVDAGPPIVRDDFEDSILYNVRKETAKRSTDPKSIKLDILREVQMIFGNLAFSQNQYFTPTGFWKHFKLWGDEVNLREQHDAVEFFNCLIDTVDESLHTMEMPKIFEEVLGGTFADQKICKGCPHRYECEEKFSTLCVDVRHHENLLESLELYVKGDLLEGDNAYYCESCKQKRDTVKRVCIKKLPLVLAIQLKRFDYDWERDTSVKFNDYFEFPNELDMAPYTVAGTYRRDHLNSINEIVRSPSLSSSDSESHDISECSQSIENSTRYTLKGVVVHGGQASGGHYYSYIREKRKCDNVTAFNCSDSCSSGINGIDNDDPGYCWYRFDDTEVTECKMDAEEMKNQWFGGDFMGESYDHIIKRVSLRRQKRWWSAYILFYEREDYANHPILNDLQQAVLKKSRGHETPSPIDGNNMFNIPRLPRHIEENITLQNIQYMHTKNQYTAEYFSFLRDLPTVVTFNRDFLPVKTDKTEMVGSDVDKMKTIVAGLLSKFLFTIGFRTNRSIRGPAKDWFESLKVILQSSEKARLVFCIHAFFYPLTKITEYLLESPNAEIREVYVTFIKFISHWSLRDSFPGYFYVDFQRDLYLKELHGFIKERFCTEEKLKLCHILVAIMHVLLNKDTNEYGSSCNEYMSLFYDYPRFGFVELSHCLDINLPTHILKYCLDEYYPNAGSPRVDINKLICSFCQLMRCYNLQKTCTDIQIEMLIPNAKVLHQTYPIEPPDIPFGAIDNPYHFIMNSKPVWKIRNIPDHLHKYLFTRTNKFIKRVIEDFYNEFTRDDLILFLKYLCYDNLQCSQVIVETLSYELEHSFIRNVKLFLELFKNILDVDDSLKVRRALIMVEGEQLDFAVRFKTSSERRCYFIMKMVLISINKLNENEKKQLWEEISNPQQTYDKLSGAINHLRNTIQNSKLNRDYRSHAIIESNEENTGNNIERTNSTEELEKIGRDMMRLYIGENTPEDSGFMSSETDQSVPDPEPTLIIDNNILCSENSCVVVNESLPHDIPPPPYTPRDDDDDDNTDNRNVVPWTPPSSSSAELSK